MSSPAADDSITNNRGIEEIESSQATPAERGVVVVSVADHQSEFDFSSAVHANLVQTLKGLSPGSLMFLYGEPEQLADWTDAFLTKLPISLQFKYWIALDLNESPAAGFLQPAHRGLVLLMKLDATRTRAPRFVLHADQLRIPHRNCTACGQNLKDWGGKKHLMNPVGAAPSDVWRDLPRQLVTPGEIPSAVLGRIAKLSDVPPDAMLHFNLVAKRNGGARAKSKLSAPRGTAPAFDQLTQIGVDQIYTGDCISFLHRTEVLHPNGLFDLAFADPPYNLEKQYGQWDDAMADQKYLDWCNAWLAGMAATLKPGGSLFVLNLPKWALHHAAFLNQHLDFRHWIAWDALSDPRGKLMPAHYALLWYTKPGGKPVCNYAPLGTAARDGAVTAPDSPQYCLRASCVKRRKALRDDAKVELSDIWFDIHRIKHKRDRDAHPCQLPDRLMERIIKLASRPGDLVFDPFCGAGTTALVAHKLGRQFVGTEIDPAYVRITEEKLAAMREHADMFGEFAVPRKSTTRKRGDITKREIERYLQELATKLSRVPTEADVLEDRPGLLPEIDRNYPNRGAAFKRAKIGL